MSQAPQNKKEHIGPRFPAPRSNGLIREDHASASMLFLQCEGAICKQEKEIREFQLKSFDAGSGKSVFRCVICGSIKILDKKAIDSARAENNNRS